MSQQDLLIKSAILAQAFFIKTFELISICFDTLRMGIFIEYEEVSFLMTVRLFFISFNVKL